MNHMLLKGDEAYYDHVLDIARQEVKIISEKDKQHYLNHPDYDDHHFGYGMYLRNNYIYGKVKVLEPDEMSEDIFEMIISLLKKDKA